MPIYVKPSGAEVEVNAGSEEQARLLGWVPVDEKPKPKRKRRTKAEMEKAK